MSAEHTPEPWRLHNEGPYRVYVVAANGNQVASMVPPHWIWRLTATEAARLLDEQQANARQIVAAVNAVEGISTDALE